MSYTHIHLPNVRKLELELKLKPNLIKYYAKYDSFIGSSESIILIKRHIKNLYS